MNKVLSIVFVAFSLYIMVPGALAQATEPRPLVLGQPIERELKGGETHPYIITAKAGDYIHILVEQNGIDVVVTLFDPDGKKLREVDSPNGIWGSEPLKAIVGASGVHRLTVTSPEKTAAAARYDVRTVEIRPASQVDRDRIAAEKVFMQAVEMHGKRTADSLVGAINKYEESLRLFRAINDADGQAITLNDLAGAHSDLGDQRQALKLLYESLPFSRAVGNKKAEAETLNNIGGVHNYLNEKDRALKALGEALTIRRTIGDKRGEAVTLSNIGRVYDDLGEKREALEFFNESLALRREVRDLRGEATTLHNIGLVYSDLGEQQQALKYYNESLAIARTIGDRYGESMTLSNIGAAYSSLGDNEQALVYYEQALTNARAAGDKGGVANLLNNIGVVSLLLGRDETALRYFNESLPQLREIGDRQGEGRTLSNIAKINSKLNDHQTALKFLNESLVVLRSAGDKRGEALTLNNLFEVWQKLNEPRLGVLFGKLSVNNYQALRSRVQGLDKNIQQTFLRSIEPTYRSLAEVLIDQKRFTEAKQVLDLFKDQQYFDFSQTNETAFVALTPHEEQSRDELNKLLNHVVSVSDEREEFKRQDAKAGNGEGPALNDLDQKLARATGDLSTFLRELPKEFAGQNGTDTTSGIADPLEMRKSPEQTPVTTGERQVTVYTLLGEKKFNALVVTRNGTTSVSYPITFAELNKKTIKLWELLRSPKHDPRLAAKELYDIVFAPIEKKLPKGTKTILWSLDGNLRYIPVAALYDGRKYLVERYQNVVFTRADKEQMTRESARDLSGAGFGSSREHTVEIGGENFKASALPQVKTELARIFGGGGGETNGHGRSAVPGSVLLDDRFTKKAMYSELEKRRPLVHIASHFRFEPGDEARSFLLLGDGSTLTLDELKEKQDIFKGVDLLTLSACETAAQKPDANGREVDGFAELAQRLGASAVMASLWEVSDSSTSELMARFYSDYAGGKTNKAAALRFAQLALLRGKYDAITDAERELQRERPRQTSADRSPAAGSKLVLFKHKKSAPFAHPFYWSPFILIGNWK